MQLKLGFMTTVELARWANITSDYLAKNKKKWCANKLSHYAKYELVRGGVNILEIYHPEYASAEKEKIKKNFNKYWGNGKDKIDTIKNMTRKMSDKIVFGISPDTVYDYSARIKREWYGVPKKYSGIKGDSYFVFCKIKDNNFYPFTPEEEAIKKELMSEYLQTREDQVIEMRALVEAYKNGEINKDEYDSQLFDLVDKDLGWITFISEFTERIGAEVGFATLLEDNAIAYADNHISFDF